MTVRAPATELPISFADVSVVMRGVTILDRISLDLESGPPTILIGPNGAGKTTLLRVAAGLVAPSSGGIIRGRVDATPVRRAIVFQRPVMLRRSAIGNVRYALKAAGVPRGTRTARAEELLAMVGLADLGDRPARKLSGGEQQRLALARALAKEPQVLFLDEPTASLDPASTKSVEDIVRSVASRGIKVVMATHDLGQARRLADDVVLMHRGGIVERTAADVFFSTPKTEEARRFVAGELLV